MKVLQLIQKPQLRGAEVFACQLANHLKNDLLIDVKVMAIYPGDATLPFEGEIIKLNRPVQKRLYDFSGWKALNEFIRSEKIEIVQANASDTLKFAVLSKVLFKWKQPIVARNASTVSLYTKGHFQKMFNRALYKRSDAVASVCDYTRQDLLNIYPNLSERTTTIPVGLEGERVPSNPYTNNSARYNLVHVGGFSFEKNHEGLLRILQLIVAKEQDVVLWLVGDGPLRETIEEKVSSIGLDKKIIFTGFVSNPQDYVAYADVLLLPSIIEGFPAVILESMLYKTPVVAYNVGGICELVKTNETGWLIPKNNEELFSQAVLSIFTSQYEVNTVVSTARERVVKNYMNDKISLSFLSLYKDIIRKKSS